MICKCNWVTALRQPNFSLFQIQRISKWGKCYKTKTPPKGRNGKYKKKNFIRSFTKFKKNIPMVFHLNQTVSQIIKMFAKLFNYHAT